MSEPSVKEIVLRTIVPQALAKILGIKKEEQLKLSSSPLTKQLIGLKFGKKQVKEVEANEVLRKVRRANCVYIVEEVSKVYSRGSNAADVDPEDRAAVEKLDQELKEQKEVLDDIQTQTKECAERYRAVFRGESTGMNHLMQLWGITPESKSLVAVL
jgi:hypothetical protein